MTSVFTASAEVSRALGGSVTRMTIAPCAITSLTLDIILPNSASFVAKTATGEPSSMGAMGPCLTPPNSPRRWHS